MGTRLDRTGQAAYKPTPSMTQAHYAAPRMTGACLDGPHAIVRGVVTAERIAAAFISGVGAGSDQARCLRQCL